MSDLYKYLEYIDHILLKYYKVMYLESSKVVASSPGSTQLFNVGSGLGTRLAKWHNVQQNVTDTCNRPLYQVYWSTHGYYDVAVDWGSRGKGGEEVILNE